MPYYYHLTSKKLLKTLSENGLTHTYARTGKREASPNGAFLKDKEKNFDKEFTGNILSILVKASRAKDPNEFEALVLNGILVKPDLEIEVTASPEDHATFDSKYQKTLQDYIQSTGEIRGKAMTTTEWKKAYDVKNTKGFAEKFAGVIDQIKSDPKHPIHQLALAQTNAKYNIEEAITSSHVYFFDEKYATQCFDDYTKYLNGDLSERILLRVHSDNLPDLAQDEADFRASLTPHCIKPGHIEVMKNIEQFKKPEYRKDSQNYQSIKEAYIESLNPIQAFYEGYQEHMTDLAKHSRCVIL
ncbi:hypothetical protein L3V83_01330 [Thiotrichales bacterium 19X7-9]|nr:hypothetical protein [Thiotrichales bacterium 19X7-9]